MQVHHDQIAIAVRELVCEFAPGIESPQALTDDLGLAAGGLGFDSVRIVELLVACEDRFRVTLPAELLDEAEPTIGALVAWVRRARGLQP